MNRYLPMLVCLFVSILCGTAFAHPHILRLSDRAEISFDEMIADLSSVQIVFIGELHNHVGHHHAQLSVIDTLRKTGADLSIGLEMFRKENQSTLDLWTDSRISERNFVEVYDQNWSMWPTYRDIFLYARSFRIPMLGLNISREITKKVASGGFDSLSEEQSETLGKVACTVDPVYMEYIRRAMGGHGGQGDLFMYFCEAQLLWDIAMAHNLTQQMATKPDTLAVVLAGSGHSWKYGIPSRMDAETYRFRVILPEVHGRVDRFSASWEDADYLWLDEGPDGWSAPLNAPLP